MFDPAIFYVFGTAVHEIRTLLFNNNTYDHLCFNSDHQITRLWSNCAILMSKCIRKFLLLSSSSRVPGHRLASLLLVVISCKKSLKMTCSIKQEGHEALDCSLEFNPFLNEYSH